MTATAIPSDRQLYGSAFRRCLVELDVNGMRKLHAHVSPHLPSPGDDRLVLATMHRARTQLRTMALKDRAYSHRWLLDHGYPSGLPDELKPRAERLYPRVVAATGFSANFGPKLLKPLKHPVEHAVGEVILDAYGTDKVDKIDHAKLRGAMLEKKDETVRKLVGRIGK